MQLISPRTTQRHSLAHIRTIIVFTAFDLALLMSKLGTVFKKTSSLIGIKDERNPTRIYVHSRNPRGAKGKAVLYLIWELTEARMSSITVFQDFRTSLSQNFRRLLTFEAVDNNSEFKREFIGCANRFKTTLDVPLIGLKAISYFYDEIGLEITHKHSTNGDEVIFAIVQRKP